MPPAQPTPAVVFGPQAPATPSPQPANQPQPMPQPEPSPAAQPQPADRPTQAVPGVVFGPQAQAAAPQPTIPAEATEPNQTPQAPFQGLSPMTPLPKPTKTKSKGKRRLLKKLLLLIIITAALTTAGSLAYNKFLVNPSPEDSFQTAIDQLLQAKSLKLQATIIEPQTSTSYQLIIQAEYLDDPDKLIIKKQVTFIDTNNPDAAPTTVTVIQDKDQSYLQLNAIGSYVDESYADHQSTFDKFFKDKWFNLEPTTNSLIDGGFFIPNPSHLDSTSSATRSELDEQYYFIRKAVSLLDTFSTSARVVAGVSYALPFGYLPDTNDRQRISQAIFAQTGESVIQLTDCQSDSEIVCQITEGSLNQESIDELVGILDASNPAHKYFYASDFDKSSDSEPQADRPVYVALKLDGKLPQSFRLFTDSSDVADSLDFKLEYSSINQALGLTIPETVISPDEIDGQISRGYLTNQIRYEYVNSVFNEIETYFMDNSIQPPQLPITGDGDKLSHLIEAEDEFSYYQLNQIYWNGQLVDQSATATLLANQPQTTEASATASFPPADKRASPERDNLYIWTSASCNQTNGLPQAVDDASKFVVQFAVNDPLLTSQCIQYSSN